MRFTRMGGTCLRSEMMVVETPGCYSKALVGVNLILAFIDGGIAVLAFYQFVVCMIEV
ncbi:hypothetical protein HanOQP8_Chr04g0159201 [Helianthus annuus]|nr:hypothetical protein HanOQP8_Chr04g0159201 [Helianthus annuus]